MAVKSNFTDGTALPASDINTYLTNGGLVYVTSATVGTAVASVTVSSAFNSTYDAYKRVWTGGTMTNDTNITLAIGGATTAYYASLIYASYSTSVIAAFGDNNNTKWTFGGGAGQLSVELINPFLATFTEMEARIRYSTVYGTNVGVLGNGNSYTSFTIAPSAGTMTGGQVTVYGYRKG